MSPWVKFTLSLPRCPAVPLGCSYLLAFARRCLSCSDAAAVFAGSQLLHSCSYCVCFSGYKLIFKKELELELESLIFLLSLCDLVEKLHHRR